MMPLKPLLALLALLAVAACDIRYPNTGTRTTDERPAIAFKGAPSGSQVFVDGLAMGEAARFDGARETLLVEPGNHLIEVRAGGKTLLSKRIYLGGGATKVFAVR